MTASNYNKNTWECLNELKAILEENTDIQPDASNYKLGLLEQQWMQAKSALSFVFDGKHVEFGRDLIDYDGENTPIELFVDMISEGLYPPPEFLMLISYILDMYFINEGDVELEEVFFGHRRKNTGNFAGRKANKRKYEKRYEKFEETYLEVKEILDFDFSLAAFAEFYFKGEEVDVETFLRGRRRWKNETDK
jgi:hypothetical protein